MVCTCFIMVVLYPPTFCYLFTSDRRVSVPTDITINIKRMRMGTYCNTSWKNTRQYWVLSLPPIVLMRYHSRNSPRQHPIAFQSLLSCFNAWGCTIRKNTRGRGLCSVIHRIMVLVVVVVVVVIIFQSKIIITRVPTASLMIGMVHSISSSPVEAHYSPHLSILFFFDQTHHPLLLLQLW